MPALSLCLSSNPEHMEEGGRAVLAASLPAFLPATALSLTTLRNSSTQDKKTGRQALHGMAACRHHENNNLPHVVVAWHETPLCCQRTVLHQGKTRQTRTAGMGRENTDILTTEGFVHCLAHTRPRWVVAFWDYLGDFMHGIRLLLLACTSLTWHAGMQVCHCFYHLFLLLGKQTNLEEYILEGLKTPPPLLLFPPHCACLDFCLL